jgi:hypothetical protein
VFCSVIVGGGRILTMKILLAMAVVTLVVQFSMLKPLDEYKKTPPADISMGMAFLTVCITASGLIGFGGPYVPALIWLVSLPVMLAVRREYPGLIIEIERMTVPMVLGGISVEYFVNHYLYAPRD